MYGSMHVLAVEDGVEYMQLCTVKTYCKYVCMCVYMYIRTCVHIRMCTYVRIFDVYTKFSNGDCHLPVVCVLCSSAGAQTGFEGAGAAGEAVQICSATASSRDASKP